MPSVIGGRTSELSDSKRRACDTNAAPGGTHAAYLSARVGELLAGAAGTPVELFDVALDGKLPEGTRASTCW
jgi:hypothetical protein